MTVHRLNFGKRPHQELNSGWGLLPDPMQRSVRQKWWRSTRRPGDFFPSYDDDAFWPTPVPAAYNRVHPQLEYYEGTLTYLNHFASRPAAAGETAWLHFEGVADRCTVFLNGRWVGAHDGGYTPFSVDVSTALAEENRLLMVVECQRQANDVPGLMHDWFHDGGIHRPVRLYHVPATHIREVAITTALPDADTVELRLRVMLSGARRDVAVPVAATLATAAGCVVGSFALTGRCGSWAEATVRLPRAEVALWDTATPTLHALTVTAGDDTWTDAVGLREVRTAGREILLNGEPVLLRGVCTWTEDPARGIFSMSAETAAATIGLIRGLNGNFARAGHRPQSREFVEACDRAGILVWLEVPAYWIPTMAQPTESRHALQALEEMLAAFRNSASVILWCVGNECLYHDVKTPQTNLNYFLEAAAYLHEQDPSRLVTYTGGFEGAGNPHLEEICPPAIIDQLDVIGINSYSGITDGVDPEKASEFDQHYVKIRAASATGKPVILAEVGIDAVRGEPGFDFGEARQADYHAKVQALFRECAAEGTLQGMSLFVLNDYKTPIKLGRFQRGYNRKGLVDEHLVPKPAYDVVARGYADTNKTSD